MQSNNIYLSLKEYELIAIKVLRKYGHIVNPSDDDISAIIEIMINADTKFDGRGNRQGYRMDNARFGVMKVKASYASKKKRHKSFNFRYAKDSMLNFVSNKDLSVTDKVLYNEILDFVENSTCFDNVQKICFNMRYIEGKTLQEIGHHFSLTREAIRFKLKKMITTIRLKMKANDD